MEDWKKYYDEAESYAKGALGAFNKSKLGSQVVYNLIGLAIENYLTALCISRSMMPEHSSIGGMIRQLGKETEIPVNFVVEARFINKFMNFCSLEVFEPRDPSHTDLLRMLRFVNDVKQFCNESLLPEQIPIN